MSGEDEANTRNLYAPQRHEEIVAEARSQGRVEVTDLARRLQVTPETIRRDLTALEQLGRVRRVHGGALPVAEIAAEPTVMERLGHNAQAKERIAARAILELPAQGTVLLDSGTTTLAIARAFPKDIKLEVITNSVAIAAILSDYEGLRVHMLGGTIRHRTGACVGEWATTALGSIRVDVAFIGINGFTPLLGATTPDQAEAVVKRAMIQSARRPIIVADSSKAGHERLHRVAKVSEIAMLITDEDLDDDTAEELDKVGIEVVRA